MLKASQLQLKIFFSFITLLFFNNTDWSSQFQSSYPIRESTREKSIRFLPKPTKHIFKVFYFSGTQMRFIIRHFSLNPRMKLSAQEWHNFIGSSPNVDNLLKRLFNKRTQQNIRTQFESVFGVIVQI